MKRMNMKEYKAKLRELIKELKMEPEDFRAIAAIIVGERKRLMEAGLRIDNEQPQVALKPSTIARKSGAHKTVRFTKKIGLYSAKAKKAESPSTPLIDTGIMMKTAPIQITKNRARIPIANARALIGKYHQDGGGRLPKRPHWGISPTAKKKIDAFIDARIRRIVRESGI